MDYVVVLSTAVSVDEAKLIAMKLLEQKLAACVNLVPKIISMYHWDNKIADDEETLLIIKTRKDLYEKVKSEILSLHSYEVPEIISFDITKGSKEYLEWILTSTK